MNIIQTYWSCKQEELLQASYGWLAPEYNLFSWALSCLQLRQYYDDVILYADSTSARVLIDLLQLPYTDVRCSLDTLNAYHKNLWALPKIYTYSLQKEPFLHVDGDVFIWEKFDDELIECELIAQNQEISTDYYEMKMQHLEKHLTFFPEVIAEYRRALCPMYAYNAGIFGGKDIDFIRHYTEMAFEFVDKNTIDLHKINVVDFNIFFEQFLFYCMARNENKKVSVLIDKMIGDNEYKGFGDFMDVPYARKYLHLIGTYKREPEVCNNLAGKLRQCYLDYYYRIISLFKKRKLHLRRDYYFLGDISEQDLALRYRRLETEPFPVNQRKDNFLIQTITIKTEGDTSEQIQDTLHKKFSLISQDVLYKRDIHAIGYCERVFSDKMEIFNKVIVTDNLIELFQIRIEKTPSSDRHKENNEQSEEPEADYYLAIIPECDKKGYTVLEIDELDILLLENLHQPLSIGNLFHSIECNFNKDDLAENKNQFEELIFGRLKKGFENKVIRFIQS